MRHLILGTIAALGAAGFMGGCGAAVGNNIVKYTRNNKPTPPTEAPSDGNYGLYYTTDANAQVKYPLHKGDRLGFVQKDDNKIYAVAGDKEVEVSPSFTNPNVYWRLLKD